MKFEYELILCIVNAGFSDAVMEAARACGAGGGTVIHARGTANKEAETFFKITIQPEKEIVMILVSEELKDDILTALYRSVGLNTPGQGIAFSMPVDAVVGLAVERTTRPAAHEKATEKKTEPKEPPKAKKGTEE